MDPDVTWESGRGCPLVVHCNLGDLQSVHGLHCYGNVTRTRVTSLPALHDMTAECEREMLAGALYSVYAYRSVLSVTKVGENNVYRTENRAETDVTSKFIKHSCS